jgi:RES domain-containing protein
LIADATPLDGDFFRSVAFRYFHPDDVISGEGTRWNGGRFVPVGVKAVYASADEETAMREVTARKRALGGRNQLDVGEYPRMTYVLSIQTQRNLDLASAVPKEFSEIVRRCLRSPQYSASQELAAIWIDTVSKVLFFHPQQVADGKLSSTCPTPGPIASPSAIVTKFSRRFGGCVP